MTLRLLFLIAVLSCVLINTLAWARARRRRSDIFLIPPLCSPPPFAFVVVQRGYATRTREESFSVKYSLFVLLLFFTSPSSSSPASLSSCEKMRQAETLRFSFAFSHTTTFNCIFDTYTDYRYFSSFNANMLNWNIIADSNSQVFLDGKGLTLFPPFVSAIARHRERRIQEGEFLHLDVPGHDVYSIRRFGQVNLVGILVGHNGARHVLRHLWHYYDVVHLLPRDETGWSNTTDAHMVVFFVVDKSFAAVSSSSQRVSTSVSSVRRNICCRTSWTGVTS